MKLEDAKKYVLAVTKNNEEFKSWRWSPEQVEKLEQKVLEALEVLLGILEEFESKHIDKIIEIEKTNPAYFPGLSIAAARTIIALREGSKSLPLDTILETVETLTARGRPWESLRAFTAIGNYCRSAITEENIQYLRTVNSDFIEIIGIGIANKMAKNSTSFLARTFSTAPKQYAGDVMQEIDNYAKRRELPDDDQGGCRIS
jgi:hypothetical protein